MIFRVSLRNQFKALEFAFFLLLFTLGCIIFFRYTDPFFYLEILIWLCMLQLIPVLYLHLEYLSLNGKCSLKLDCNQSILTYANNREVINLSFNNIVHIVSYLPPSAYRGPIERKMHFLPMESYGYAIIYSKEGERIIVTSLMVPDMNKELEKVSNIPIERKKRLFASPSVERIVQWFNRDQ